MPSPVPSPAPSTLLANGSFESPSAGAPLTVYHAGDSIGRWRVAQSSVNLVRSNYSQAADGSQSIDLNGDLPAPTNGAIAQTFHTTTGQKYALSFHLAGNPTCTPVVKTMTLKVGAVTRDFSFDTTGHSNSAMGWRLETVRFTATGDRTTLRLASTTDPNSQCGPQIDSVKVVRA